MDWVPIVGTFSLGIVVMWVVRLFAVLVKKPEIKWLWALLSALLGGVALGFLGKFTNQGGIPWPREFWFYPVGLLFGLVVLALSEPVGKQMEEELNRLRALESNLRQKSVAQRKPEDI